MERHDFSYLPCCRAPRRDGFVQNEVPSPSIRRRETADACRQSEPPGVAGPRPGGGRDPLRRAAGAPDRRRGDGALAEVPGRELRPHGRSNRAHPVRLRPRVAPGRGHAVRVQVGQRGGLAPRWPPHPHPRRALPRRGGKHGRALQGGHGDRRLLRVRATPPALRSRRRARVLDHQRPHQRLPQPVHRQGDLRRSASRIAWMSRSTGSRRR
jgi:hypothetical protein